jgi:HD-GYP domain-containing protein (c-di-GMP phosphodiesterase class II)
MKKPLREAGDNFISFFYTLIKAVQVHDLRNDVVQSAAQKFLEYINSIFTTATKIEIVRYRDYIFFNKQRLRFKIDRFASLQFIDSKLRTLKIKSLTFLPGIHKEEILKFSSIFKLEKDSFLKQFTLEKFEHIQLEFATKEDEIPELLKDGERVKRTYFRALKGLRNLMQNLWTDRPVDVISSRRIVYSLLNALFQDEFGLLALATLKNIDEYTFNHSLNVGILSMALGQRIDLNRKSLAQLGTAGLLHDLGKVDIPKEIMYKVELSNEEWEKIKLHSVYGVKEIVRIRELDEIGMVGMVVAYQHHWNYDGTGYPTREKDEKPTLFAKIVRICDAYDAMTSPRTYQPIPYLRHYALRILWAHRQTWFDPILVKAFIQLLGIYPVGSCLELSSGEIGLVVRQNAGYLDLPLVKIVLNRQGENVDGATVDLSLEKGVNIVRPIFPQQYGINPATYFV